MSRQTLHLLLDKCIASDDDLITIVANTPKARIQTVNLHHLALAKHSSRFAEVTADADFVTADGWPIVSAMRGMNQHVERVTGSEFTQRLLTDRRLQGLRIGLLGASAESGDKFAKKLSDTGIELVFRDHGSRDDWSSTAIVASLIDARVDLLLVAVTPPYGDEVADQIHRDGFPGTVMAVGGAIDMIVDTRRPAPKLIKKLKSEWLFRLVQEPRRLFRRYVFLCLPVFLLDVLPVAARRFLRK